MSHSTSARALALAIGLALLAPSSARAEIPFCVGTIQRVYVNSAGNVYANPSWHGGWIQYCNLNTARGGVTPKVCSSWYAALLLAYQTQKSTITASFDGSVSTCKAWASYDAAQVPNYFMVQ